MLDVLMNIWKVVELRKKLLFTIGMLAIYRIGFMIPLPGVDMMKVADFSEKAKDSDISRLLVGMQMFSGGQMTSMTLFSLGIMPYISAAIIFQLLGSVYEPFKKLKKEGASGQQKIQEYTRYATVGLCFVQSFFMMRVLASQGVLIDGYDSSWIFWIGGVLSLTAGSCFLMWLGEQIDRFGIGNGISLIITAGIVASMPAAIGVVWSGVKNGEVTTMMAIFLAIGFVVVVAGATILHLSQRRIPIEQAKHSRGRAVFGGQRAYLPLRVNHSGVMPIIFASSLLMFPSMAINFLSTYFVENPPKEGGFMAVVQRLNSYLAQDFAMMHGFLYVGIFIVMIYFFSFFWASVQFNPEETATQLRDRESFIPGLRPGPRTAEYLENVMERLTYAGAGFLALIAVVPILLTQMGVDFMVANFLGGTGLLICVSVILDFAQRIEAQLMMRNLRGGAADEGKKQMRVRADRTVVESEGAMS